MSWACICMQGFFFSFWRNLSLVGLGLSPSTHRYQLQCGGVVFQPFSETEAIVFFFGVALGLNMGSGTSRDFMVRSHLQHCSAAAETVLLRNDWRLLA